MKHKELVIGMIQDLQRLAANLDLTNEKEYVLWVDLNEQIDGLLQWLFKYEQ